MLAVLSPAKSLDFSTPHPEVIASQPELMKDATSLMRTARGLSQKRLRDLMHLSPELAKLNYHRFRSFELPFRGDNARPAVFAFDGAVFKTLDARSLGEDGLEWAQNRLAILSGMFGVLRPFDLIQPYRLEMGTRLKTRRGTNLYQFWGDKISSRIREMVAAHDDQTLINLASHEYFRSIKQAQLPGPVIECVFEDWKEHEDDAKVIGFLAKQARGAMARFLATERIDRVEGLKDFSAGGYGFRSQRSSDSRWVFARKFIPVNQAASI